MYVMVMEAGRGVGSKHMTYGILQGIRNVATIYYLPLRPPINSLLQLEVMRPCQGMLVIACMPLTLIRFANCIFQFITAKLQKKAVLTTTLERAQY